ncbi:MAG: FHA domain-containing protein [candidate division WOR-3 bacterium]
MKVKIAFGIPTIFLLLLLDPVTIYAPSDVTVGFHTQSLSLQPYIRSFTLNITVFSGGSKIVAGEFNASYPAEYISLLRVNGCENWTVTYVANKYIFYTLVMPKDRTVVASLIFNVKPTAENKMFKVKLDFFRAADINGNDLNVAIHPSETKITLLEEIDEKIEKPSAKEHGWELSTITLMISTSLAFAILIISLYFRTRKIPHGYYLVDQNGRIILRCNKPDRAYGREDFLNIIDSRLLQYITRRSEGGQFRIVKIGKQFFIIDNYSTNPTMVNGVEIKGRGPTLLNDGSIISISNIFSFIFKTRRT